MRLRRVGIENFLVLQDIDVVFEDTKVVFLNGLNGRGKTTFQKALSWCLYGIEPSENPSILSDSAFEPGTRPGAKAKVSVRMFFDVNTEDFATIEIERNQWFECLGGTEGKPVTQPQLTILGKGPNNSDANVPLPDPEGWMKDYYPKNLSQFFLFDGEMLEKFFQVQTKGAIGQAVREIAGVEVFEKVIEQCQALAEEWTRKKNQGAGSSVQAIEVERATKRKLITALEKQLAEAKARREEVDQRIEELDQLIGKSEAATAFLEEDAQLASDLAVLEAAEGVQKREFETILFEEAPEYLFGETIPSVLEEREKAVSAGEYPPSFTPELMNEILEREICVCGTPIVEDSKEHQHLSDLVKEYEGTNQIGRKLQKIVATVEVLGKSYPNFREKVITKNGVVAQLFRDIDSKARRRAEIDGALLGVDRGSLESYTAERAALRKELTDELSVTIQSIETQLPVEQSRIRDLEKRIDKANANTELKAKFDRKIGLSRRVSSYAQRANQIANQMVRERLEAVVSEEFSRVKGGEFITHITEEFEIQTLTADGKRRALSAGENMMKAYIFAIALRKVIGFEFPLIVDTPYGRLGEVYRMDVTDMVKNMAETSGVQTIFLMHDGEYTPHAKAAFESTNPQELYFTYAVQERKSIIKEGIDPDWAEGPLWSDWWEKQK